MRAKEADAIKLRQEGKSYKEIEHLLGITTGMAWQLVNRDKHNENCRDSVRRYRARGRIALCDMERST